MKIMITAILMIMFSRWQALDIPPGKDDAHPHEELHRGEESHLHPQHQAQQRAVNGVIRIIVRRTFNHHPVKY